MARMLTGPKCKLCRREGEKLFLKGERCLSTKCAFDKRPYPPGMHGLRRKGRRDSIYGIQLRQKQKVRRIYGVMEGQFRRFYEMALKMPGNTGENFLSLLERRLDNVVYRLGFAKSRSQAKQFINHGHIRVNGLRNTIPSYLVREKDQIAVDESFVSNPELLSALESFSTTSLPGWLSKTDKFSGTVNKLPTRLDIPYEIDERLIVEFYSR